MDLSSSRKAVKIIHELQRPTENGFLSFESHVVFCNSGHDTYNGGELKVSRSLNYIELRPCPAEYGYKINCESSWDLILESDTESLS